MEMRMLDAAALPGGYPLCRDLHPARSAATPKQEAFIRAAEYDGPVMVFDLDLLRRSTARWRPASATR
jgi:hypothetical protein